MSYRIDMIHHNPGEAPFDTAFSDPQHLLRYGYNGQAFKHINTVATFEAVAPGVFPATDAERVWLAAFTADREKEIADAKAAGLEVYYHIDLFVLPKRILEHFGDELLDPETGRIDLHRERTMDLHRALFAEICERFPQIDGFIVRVGETYLFDTPFHEGNGAVHYHPDRPVDVMQADFVHLLKFLREVICEEQGKTLIHRTWDTWPNRFHASRDFYLAVTDQIEPHPDLIFSIKHTQVDFHRWVSANPCLGVGQHPQVVEVQCQREYEGKGAYPNYAVKGIIDGFSEPGTGQGLRPLMSNPLICGIYTWSRGGGWYGPYVNRSNELWCDLNAYVIACFAEQPERDEAAIFNDYATEVLGLPETDAAVFRAIALASLDAVVHGKCCAAFDNEPALRQTYPTNQWMRDDVLHGLDKLAAVFDHLLQTNQVEAALEEKRRCVHEWEAMRARCDDFSTACPVEVRETVTASVNYGRTLFTAIAAGWEVLLGGHIDPKSATLPTKVAAFDTAWAAHLAFCEVTPRAATPYRAEGWHWPNTPTVPGLMASIDQLR